MLFVIIIFFFSCIHRSILLFVKVYVHPLYFDEINLYDLLMFIEGQYLPPLPPQNYHLSTPIMDEKCNMRDNKRRFDVENGISFTSEPEFF